MLEKRKFLDFNKISEEEYKFFIEEEYNDNPNYKTEQTIYKVILILFLIYGFISLIYYYKLRHSYLIRHSHFLLTFIGGIAAYINVFVAILPQCIKIPCFLNVFSANILNIFINLIFFVRSVRVILYYHLNFFKVSSVKKSFLNVMNSEHSEFIEPNHYLIKIHKRINTIVTLVIVVPTVIAILIITVMFMTDDYLRGECKFFESEDALYRIKKNDVKKPYYVIIFAGIIFTILNIINTILLCRVKDINKCGVKFECISVSICIIITNIINVFLQKLLDSDQHDQPRIFIKIFNITKGGKLLYAFISLYMFFASITLPTYHYYKAKTLKNKYFHDPMCSLQYFYKVLNNPTLVKELREIAIKEFSVENVLFWENYQLLQKMSKEFQLEYKNIISRDKNKSQMSQMSQFSFDSYYMNQMNYYQLVPNNDNNYDPQFPIPKQHMRYFISFYHMFIDVNGPAVINIDDTIVKGIINELCTYPTVGIYDGAANEVIEMMYISLYPILLKQNKKHIINTVS